MPVDGDVLQILPPVPPHFRSEGGEDMEGCPDQFEDCIGLFKHFLVGEAQDGDAPTAEEGVTKSYGALRNAASNAASTSGLTMA